MKPKLPNLQFWQNPSFPEEMDGYFMKHVGSEDLEKFGAPELKEFLTELAVKEAVAANTQNQALRISSARASRSTRGRQVWPLGLFIARPVGHG